MASAPAEFGIELDQNQRVKKCSTMPCLPVVDGGELAILHQLVPEAGEALAGENLFRVGKEFKTSLLVERLGY